MIIGEVLSLLTFCETAKRTIGVRAGRTFDPARDGLSISLISLARGGVGCPGTSDCVSGASDRADLGTPRSAQSTWRRGRGPLGKRGRDMSTTDLLKSLSDEQAGRVALLTQKAQRNTREGLLCAT
jgi:hypothetical protein